MLGNLEQVACKICSSIGFDTGEGRIEACHQLIKSKHAIVKFSQRIDFNAC